MASTTATFSDGANDPRATIRATRPGNAVRAACRHSCYGTGIRYLSYLDAPESDLTPELSGRAQAVTRHDADDRSWQFIHGRSAQTKVRSKLQFHSLALGIRCNDSISITAMIEAACQRGSCVRMLPRGKRRNRTGLHPQRWQSASTTFATTWPAPPPTLAAGYWQSIHDLVSTRDPSTFERRQSRHCA
jgi:hypothetical protein